MKKAIEDRGDHGGSGDDVDGDDDGGGCDDYGPSLGVIQQASRPHIPNLMKWSDISLYWQLVFNPVKSSKSATNLSFHLNWYEMCISEESRSDGTSSWDF